MGFDITLRSSSSFLKSPPLFQSYSHPLRFAQSNGSSSCSAPPPSSRRKVAGRRRTKLSTVASLRHLESPEDGGDTFPQRRRDLLLAGISALPILILRPVPAAEAKDEHNIKMTEAQDPQLLGELSYEEQNQPEKVHVRQGSENTFVSLLNELGIIGSGALGSLYAIARKDKADMLSTIESLSAALNKKEAAKALLEKDYERRLLSEQEEHQKQVRKLKEDEASLSDQLASVKGTVAALGQELRSEKRSVEELKFQIDRLNIGIAKASEDKRMLEAKLKEKLDTIDVLQDRVSLLTLEITDKEKNIETLKVSVAEKESECKNLNSIIDQMKTDLEEAKAAIKQLETELFEAREELHLKKCSIDDLDLKVKSLLKERDDANKKLDILHQDYDDLKSTSAKRAASDYELLSKKDVEIRQLEKRLGLALSEEINNQALIVNLTQEKDTFQAMLEEEKGNVKILREELQTTQDSLGASKLEVSDLSKQLHESIRLTQKLMSEVSRAQADSSEAQKLLNDRLNDAKSTSKLLSDELVSVKETLRKMKAELEVVSDELKAAVESRESLKKELLEIYKKAEITGHELKEERKLASALNRELEASEKLIQKHSGARKTLENDLDEATKSLDEMNKRALTLSRELENANSRIASLEAEKEMLYKSLNEQKNTTREAQENIEDAQNLITRLGAEREKLENRAKKLEEDLAAAKGEILRLRRQTTLNKGSANGHHKGTNEVETAASVSTKKNVSRRRKTGPTPQVSQDEN